jgi:hypothetical protein
MIKIHVRTCTKIGLESFGSNLDPNKLRRTIEYVNIHMRLIDAPDFTCESALGFTPAILSCNVDLATNDIDDAVQIDVRRSNNNLCYYISY